MDVEDESTMNCWAYSENWNDGQSSPIFSHYNKGGYKLEYMNHGLYYSYIFPSQGEGKISIIPANITDSSELINTLVYGGNPESVAVDLDGYIWISAYNAISTETRILKLSPSARVLESVNIENIQGEQIIIADDDYGYIKTVTGDMRKFNLNSMAVTTVSSVPSGNYIYVDADGTLGSEEGSSIDTFIDGTTFVVNDGVLTRDGVVVPKFTADDGSYQMLYNKVVCDNDSYYFLTMNDEEETDSDQNVTSTAYLYMVAKDDVGIFNRVSIDAVGAGSPNAVFLLWRWSAILLEMLCTG